MTFAVPIELVAGVVRQLRFAERALLADEPTLAARHLSTAADLIAAAQLALPPAGEYRRPITSGS